MRTRDSRTWQSRKDSPPRLLRVVGGKPYARDCDHDDLPAKGEPTRRAEPATDDEPESSGDELANSSPAYLSQISRPRHLSKDREISNEQHNGAVRASNTTSNGGDPPAGSQSSTGEKRKRGGGAQAPSIHEDEEEDEDDSFIFDSTARKPRVRRTYINIHAKPTPMKQTKDSAEPNQAFKPPRKLRDDLADAGGDEPHKFNKPNLRLRGDRSSPVDTTLQKFHKPNLRLRSGGMSPVKTTLQKFKAPAVPSATLSRPQRKTARSSRARKLEEDVEEDISATPLFKQPKALANQSLSSPRHEGLDQVRSIASSASSSSLTSISSSEVIPSSDLPLEVIQDLSFDEGPAVCPMCQAPVPAAMLPDFLSRGTRMSVREQAAFCRDHQHQTAAEIWAARGYPQIDWEGLDGRFRSFHDLLHDLLEGHTRSHFREDLEKRMKAGRQRTLLQSLGAGAGAGMMPGYYGARGARMMSDHIITHFSARLRTLAASDRIIACGGGVAAYIQAVLVPELATFLVQEDMHVDAEEARQILDDSREVGELLSEEIEDGRAIASRKRTVIELDR